MKGKTSAKNIAAKGSFALAFSVGSVLFSAHAGGGFATGNQANTYYVGLGWLGPISAVIAKLYKLRSYRGFAGAAVSAPLFGGVLRLRALLLPAPR